MKTIRRNVVITVIMAGRHEVMIWLQKQYLKNRFFSGENSSLVRKLARSVYAC